jgi:hypothetical protein
MDRYVYVENGIDEAMIERGFVSEASAKERLRAVGRINGPFGLDVVIRDQHLETIEKHGQRWLLESDVAKLERHRSPLAEREAEHIAAYGRAMNRPLNDSTTQAPSDPGMASLVKFGKGASR